MKYIILLLTISAFTFSDSKLVEEFNQYNNIKNDMRISNVDREIALKKKLNEEHMVDLQRAYLDAEFNNYVEDAEVKRDVMRAEAEYYYNNDDKYYFINQLNTTFKAKNGKERSNEKNN